MGSAWGQEGSGYYPQPDVAARAAVLMNAVTGEMLFAKEPHLRLPPASTTKVLTAMLVLDRLDLNSRVRASEQAASTVPSRIGLRAGETASTEDLLYGLLLKSGNDAAETLAEAAGGSVYGFSELMNARAWQIGARDSHFMNPHGLPDEEHYSSAYDMALIFRHAMNHPTFSDIVRTRSATLRIESGQGPYGDSRLVQVMNHNRLLSSYEGTRGGKTGFTLKARRCFVGEVDRGGVRLIVSIMGSPSSGTLWEDARTLLDYGFARNGVGTLPPVQPDFEPRPILVRNTPVTPKTPDYLVWSRPAREDDEELEPPALTQPKPVPARTASRATPAPDDDFGPAATPRAPIRTASRAAPAPDDDFGPAATSRASAPASRATPAPDDDFGPAATPRASAPVRAITGPVVDQPAVVTGNLARVLAKRKTLADSSDEPVAAPVRAKAAPNAKPTAKVATVAAKTKPTAVAKAKPETKDSAKTKPAALAVAKAKPETKDSAKVKPAADAAQKAKSGKEVVVAMAKPDKRTTTAKQIARAEPTIAKLPQKNAKRGI